MKSKYLGLIVFALFGLTLGVFVLSVLSARAAPLASTYFVDGTGDASLPGTCTLVVGGYSCPTLRSAVIAANANPGSEIVLMHGATYTLTATAVGALHITANTTIDYGSVICSFNCPATIKGGAGWTDRILLISNNANVQITGVTIRDGNLTGGTCGGGIYLNTGNLTLTNSTVTNNMTSSDGGGICGTGIFTLNNTNVVSNTAGGFGGGVYAIAGKITLNSTNVVSNTAGSNGGGINNASGMLTITNSSIVNNTSGTNAGGVYNNRELVVMSSTISDNRTATNAGGIYNIGTLTMTNSTLSGNKANVTAGGLFNSTTTTLNNVTIANNTADDDNNGTGYGGGVSNLGTLNLMNTLIGTNISKSGTAPDCIGTLTSQGYNLIGDTTNCTLSGSLSGVISNTNPFIGPLANFGGATNTHALLVGSPAINAGNPGALDGIGNHCMPTDQRGVTRPIAGRCDIGAFEGTGGALYLPLILR